MQVSNRLFYDRAAASMGALTARAETLGTQISTGKRLAAPSDDSVAYQRLQGLARGAADDTAYGANVKLAQGVLAQADTTLGAIGDQLTRARELAVQAGGTLTESARLAIATELDGIVSTIAGLAATTDLRGQPLFGTGTDAAAAIPIGDGQSVETGIPATRFLAAGNGRAIAAMLTSLSGALKTGTGVSAAATRALDDVRTIADQTTTAQASLGARAARVELVAAQLAQTATTREEARSSLEDTDVTAAVTELQKTMTVLQATQASFAKLSSLSLFDYLR